MIAKCFDENLLRKKVGTKQYLGVSENSGTPKSSILIGVSIVNHPIWGTPIFGNTHISIRRKHMTEVLLNCVSFKSEEN